MSRHKVTGVKWTSKSSCDVGMHSGNFRVYSVKIGKYQEASDTIRKTYCAFR